MQSLHEALRGTRGAAAMLSVLCNGRLEGCGVGNVEMRSIGAYVPVVQSPGILGVRVRRYNVFASDVAPGARLVLFSDGISAQAPVGQTHSMGAREACDFLFRGYRRSHDDATILVVDVRE
jgi:negative regulator of sigma-B (phosphoserine phosphatase)